MSRIEKDEAILIRTYDYGESSLIAVFLTRRNGKIRVMSKGAKKGKGRSTGNFLTGSLYELVFYHNVGRGLQTLKEAECLKAVDNALGDLPRLCIFQAGLEVIDRAVIEQEADERAFGLLEEFLWSLPSAEDPWFLFFAFEVKLLELIGFLPDIFRCGRCGADLGRAAFSLIPSLGEIRCGRCSGNDVRLISGSSAGKLVEMGSGNLRDLSDRRLDRRERREIGSLLHEMFLNHVEKYRLPVSLKILKGVD